MGWGEQHIVFENDEAKVGPAICYEGLYGKHFAGFAREIGRVRGNYTDQERLHAASVADSELWHEGVEAVLDIANDELIMDVKRKSNIAYTTLFELIGLTTQSLDNHLAMAQRHARSSITPHSTYSLQDQIFRDACTANNAVISVHLLESDDESELYAHRGSLAEWYKRMGWECDFLHYGAPAQRVVRSIEPSRNVVLVHGCRATGEDVALISDHFKDNVTWALCPESNRYISNDRPPVELLRKMGCRIGIGTDSLASARSLSLIDNLRLIDNVPLDEALTWATKGGAEALGMDHLGEIAVGKRPGLVIIRDADLHNLRLTPESRAERVV